MFIGHLVPSELYLMNLIDSALDEITILLSRRARVKDIYGDKLTFNH